ncbi:hypothetical protein EVJ58_g7293 [Rhodofomes roseus]|uniref:Uncharacterized protein n=1 Tax=Rhodofomes roseus TaxID=34475 RepID=A0A4Y9Y3R0_9APHY|nr:hypothetical protein EVJ58_g7293 [Rhodofomes roseus]
MTTHTTKAAINALLTTISHCALVTTGFNTGVRGTANAGTARTFLNLTVHPTFTPASFSSCFSA